MHILEDFKAGENQHRMSTADADLACSEEEKKRLEEHLAAMEGRAYRLAKTNLTYLD